MWATFDRMTDICLIFDYMNELMRILIHYANILKYLIAPLTRSANRARLKCLTSNSGMEACLTRT